MSRANRQLNLLAPQTSGARFVGDIQQGSRVVSSFRARVKEPTVSELEDHARALEERGHQDDGGRVVPVLISTALRARDGHIIEDWTTEHYTDNNPVVLWGHDRSILPIGRAPVTTWDKSTGELRSLAQFTPRDVNPMGWQIGELVARGYLNQPSVGWNTVDFSNETDREVLRFFPQAMRIHLAELLEFSVVNVEADTATGFGRALKRARSEGMDITPALQWAERAMDENESIRSALHEFVRDNNSKTTIDMSSNDTVSMEIQMNPDQLNILMRDAAEKAIAAALTKDHSRCCGAPAGVTAKKDEEEKRQTRDPELVASVMATMEAFGEKINELIAYVQDLNKPEGEEAPAEEEEERADPTDEETPNPEQVPTKETEVDFESQLARMF